MVLQVNLCSLFDLDLHQVVDDAQPAHSEPMSSASVVPLPLPIAPFADPPVLREAAAEQSALSAVHSVESLRLLDDPQDRPSSSPVAGSPVS